MRDGGTETDTCHFRVHGNGCRSGRQAYGQASPRGSEDRDTLKRGRHYGSRTIGGKLPKDVRPRPHFPHGLTLRSQLGLLQDEIYCARQHRMNGTFIAVTDEHLQGFLLQGDQLWHRRHDAVWTATSQLPCRTLLAHFESNFMPSASAALGHSQPDRDLLGGWGAEGSERYSQVAKYRVGLIQLEVDATFQLTDHRDPVPESDTLTALTVFLLEQGTGEAEQVRTLRLLASRRFCVFNFGFTASSW